MIFPSGDSVQYKIIIIFYCLSTFFSSWLAFYALSNYRFKVEVPVVKGNASGKASTKQNQKEKKSNNRHNNKDKETISLAGDYNDEIVMQVIIIPHLYCIGQLGLATSLNSMAHIFYSFPHWNEALFCYFTNGLAAYGRNASCLWSFTIVTCLYYLIHQRDWCTTNEEKNKFLGKMLKINWILPLLPTIAYLLVWTVWFDPKVEFVATDDDFEQNCLFNFTYKNEDDDEEYFAAAMIADLIQLVIPAVTSVIAIVLLVISLTQAYQKNDYIGKHLCLSLCGYPLLNSFIVILSFCIYGLQSNVEASIIQFYLVSYMVGLQGILEAFFFTAANHRILFFSEGKESCFYFCSHCCTNLSSGCVSLPTSEEISNSLIPEQAKKHKMKAKKKKKRQRDEDRKQQKQRQLNIENPLQQSFNDADTNLIDNAL